MNLKLFSKINLLNRILFVLAIIGILIALYVIQSFYRDSPIVCVNNGCELVRKSPYSYLWGIPVPSFGLVGYTLLAILSFLRAFFPHRWLLMAMIGISLFGVSFVSWFSYIEVFKIQAICTWCAISAFNMVIILFLTLRSYQLTRKL